MNSHKVRFFPLVTVATAGVAFLLLSASPHDVQAGGKKIESQAKLASSAGKIGSDGKQIVTITMEINKDWYAYANPVKNEDLEAAQTIVKITAGAKLQKVDIFYPAGKQKTIDKDKFHIYEGKVEITATVQRAAGDTSPLTVDVQFSTCNVKGICLPTENVKLVVK